MGDMQRASRSRSPKLQLLASPLVSTAGPTGPTMSPVVSPGYTDAGSDLEREEPRISKREEPHTGKREEPRTSKREERPERGRRGRTTRKEEPSERASKRAFTRSTRTAREEESSARTRGRSTARQRDQRPTDPQVEERQPTPIETAVKEPQATPADATEDNAAAEARRLAEWHRRFALAAATEERRQRCVGGRPGAGKEAEGHAGGREGGARSGGRAPQTRRRAPMEVH
uniref:Uncharacterized protein n=1 Tax=Drosophila pseudoobscura pseudoobscura TaxID=46245 RepID=A0A0R3NVZ0_DROPS